MKTKIAILILVTIIAVAITFIIKPVPQSPDFHDFEDARTIFGIPGFWNVITNLAFLVVGIRGFARLAATPSYSSDKIIFFMLFTGIVLTGIGSGYYHWHPNNDTLVWDRIPMTVVFMSFLCSTIGYLINRKAAIMLLFPLISLGIFSVLWWHHTEQMGHGDLRLYGFVQYYPMLVLLLMIIMFYSRINPLHIKCLAYILAWYVLAKIFERFDKVIFENLGVISGHSLKHLAAAVATWYIVKLYDIQRLNYS